MKLLLVFPPTRQGVKSPLLQTEGEGIGHKPPLGLLSIAAFVHGYSRHRVAVLDLDAQPLSEPDIIRHLAEIQPEVVGLSCWTDFWYPAWNLAKLIKQHFPAMHITMGGPHVGVFPAETLQHDNVDSIILGDGEAPTLNLLDHLERGVPLMDRGVYIKGNFLPSEMLFYIESDLDRIPIIDRTLLPLENYTSVLSSRPQITTMITSRGCPHKCVYCKLSFQKPVSHSAQHVVAEMKEIVRLGFREVEIYDDTFTWSKPRLVEICERLIADKVPLEWAVRDRVSNTDEKTLNLMKRAGCRRIHLGIESGNPIILKRIKKGITLEQARQAVKLAKQAGLKVLTYFMIGLPGETRQEVKDTIDFALSLDSDYAEFNVTIPYPGTEMYQEALTEKIIPVDYWRNYALNPIPDFKIPHFYEEHLAIQEMVQLTNLATRRFYFRPRLLWRELMSCLNVAEFRKKAAMGLNLLKQSLPALGRKSLYKD